VALAQQYLAQRNKSQGRAMTQGQALGYDYDYGGGGGAYPHYAYSNPRSTASHYYQYPNNGPRHQQAQQQAAPISNTITGSIGSTGHSPVMMVVSSAPVLINSGIPTKSSKATVSSASASVTIVTTSNSNSTSVQARMRMLILLWQVLPLLH
jgi:hypothetical protein